MSNDFALRSGGTNCRGFESRRC